MMLNHALQELAKNSAAICRSGKYWGSGVPKAGVSEG